MESIGEYLKRMRDERGLSIEEVARKTRISPTYIRALDENRLEKFPGEVFARGFVRVYGRCLGLDDQDTMSRFNQTAQSFFRQRDENRRDSEETAEIQKSQKEFQSRIVQIAVVAALGLAILTVYSMNAKRSTDKDEGGGLGVRPPSVAAPEPSSPAESHLEPTEPAVNRPALKEAEPKPANVPAEAPAPSKPSAVPKPPAAPKPPAPPPAKPVEKLPLVVNVPGQPPAPAASPKPVESLVLMIEAEEASWVSAKIDGGETKEVFLQAGEKVTWKASDHFLISLGNAGGVKIQFNGKPLPPFGPKGAVVKDIKIVRE